MRYGVDVSDWQGPIFWPKVWNNLDPIISFVYSKATDGAAYESETFAENHDMVRQDGRHFGAYHFFRFEDDPNEQADFFIRNTLNNGRGGDLIPMVDVETGYASAVSLGKFLSAVQSAFQVPRVLIYTDAGYWDSTAMGDGFSGHPLWIADFIHVGERPEGSPPATGGWTDWTVWQYDNAGAVSGIGNTDLNCCRDLTPLLRQGV